MIEIDQKLEELQKQASSPSNRPSTKIQEKALERLKGISETDPELAKAIADVIADATDEVADGRHDREIETLKLLRDDTSRKYQDYQANRLLEMYPNAMDVFNSPSWTEWEKKQTKGIRALANSDNADDVALAFERYAKDMLDAHPELVEKKEEAKPQPPTENTQAAQIEKERQRRKESAANVSSPTAAGKVSLPDDPDALFKMYSEQIRKQRLGD
jgi:hypothetical protein